MELTAAQRKAIDYMLEYGFIEFESGVYGRIVNGQPYAERWTVFEDKFVLHVWGGINGWIETEYCPGVPYWDAESLAHQFKVALESR